MAEHQGGKGVKLGASVHSSADSSLITGLSRLPPTERWPLTSGLSVVPLNSTLVGLICNSYFRRMCKLRGKGVILSMLPIAGGCAVTMQAIWQATIVAPLLQDRLACPLCAELRGGLVNFTFGSLYPLMLTVPINGALASMYRTIEVPTLSKKTSPTEFVRFWVKKLRYFKVQFVTLSVFQVAVGGYLAHKQYQSVQLLRMVRAEAEMTSSVT